MPIKDPVFLPHSLTTPSLSYHKTLHLSISNILKRIERKCIVLVNNERNTHQSTKHHHHPPHVPLLYTNLYNFSLIKFFQLKKNQNKKTLKT